MSFAAITSVIVNRRSYDSRDMLAAQLGNSENLHVIYWKLSRQRRRSVFIYIYFKINIMCT